MLDAGILALGVFAHDDQIDAGIARRQSGKIRDGAEVRVQLKFLAQVPR